MILEIIENVEKQLEEISENPSVKLYEHFIRRNSPTLHIKHYLNLFGETSDSDFASWFFALRAHMNLEMS